jgi:hypothetical protein
MPFLLIGLLALGGLAWWELSKNSGGSAWTKLPAGTTSLQPGNYRFSITVPAGQAASAPMMGPILQQALQTVGWTNVTVYLPGSTFPSDWPDSDPTELRVGATLPPGVSVTNLPVPATGGSVWYQNPNPVT